MDLLSGEFLLLLCFEIESLYVIVSLIPLQIQSTYIFCFHFPHPPQLFFIFLKVFYILQLLSLMALSYLVLLLGVRVHSPMKFLDKMQEQSLCFVWLQQ